MFIELPVVENRIAQFAARFERHGQGWVYHGDRLLGGLPVSDAEHAALIAEHMRILRRGERVMRWWLPVAVILCVAGTLYFGGIDGSPDPWLCAPVLLLPLPWVFLEWRRADRLALDLAGRRVAVTPPRTRWEAARSRLVAMPTVIAVMLLLASAAIVGLSSPWRTGDQRLSLAEGAAGMAFGAWMLWLKRSRR